MYTRIKFASPLLFLFMAILMAGCVTKKKKEDVSKMGKRWHDMNARYNAYYNATVLIEESTLALEQQHEDNYNKILPIYKYSAADNPKAEAENLDIAIEKMAVDVKLHQPSYWVDDCYLLAGKAMYLKQDYESAENTFEYVVAEFSPQKMAERESVSKARKKTMKAIKQGKAPAKDENGNRVKLTKKQREKLAKKKRKLKEKERKAKKKAIQKKRKQSKKNKKKKGSSSKKTSPKKEEPKKETKKPTEEVVVKKDTLPLGPNGYPLPGSVVLGGMDTNIEDGDAESYFMKHRPAYQEAVLWLARTYIERENYTLAERLIGQLERNTSTFPDIRREAAVAKAHMYMAQYKYDEAAEPLQTALETTKDKAIAARLQYILGQVHQEAGRGPQAYAAFEEVLKSQPSFEMEFGARLNLALAESTQEASIKRLERMAKEEKNQDFVDRIYFAMAEIDLKQGDKKAAIKHLEMALNSSTRDMAQKAEAYLLLADLYYENQKYVDAKLYYDSTLMVLNQQDERYPRANSLAGSLSGIAENITIIQTQDSLLTIGRMTDEEKRVVAFNIKKAEEERRREEARKKAAGPSTGGRAPSSGGARPIGGGGINGASNFWAYDARKVKDGKREFDRKWGSRQLADNWRLSNQQSLEESEEAEILEDPSILTQEEIDEILKDVPTTADKIDAANRQIEAAMYSLGTQYRNKIQNYENSIETLKELLNRYPETQYQLDALYYLYLAYTDLGDAANAQYYYDKIVNEFPQTNYARMLRDPDYATRTNSKDSELETYYRETYAQFTNRKYKEASSRISKVGEKFGSTNKFQPRFALLNAMCVGNLEGKEKYIDALKDVIARHNDQPEAKTAREMLRNLGVRASGPGQQRAGAEGQVGNFKINDTQLHYVIVVFYNKISLNDAKVGVSEYNSKYHGLQKLRMNNIYLGTGEDKYPIVAIRRFKDKTEAMDYYDGILKNKVDFLDEEKFEYVVLPIAQDNYRELLKSKALEDYRDFFELNYFE